MNLSLARSMVVFAQPMSEPEPAAPLPTRKRFLPYRWLVPIALLLGLAPFFPEPHLVEKLRMLMDGTLERPIDVFDLLLHGIGVLLLAIRGVLDLRALVATR